jgi:hypothetical protein
LEATQGATAIDMNIRAESNKVISQHEEEKIIQETTKTKDMVLEDISIENATYLQNMEDMSSETNQNNKEDIPNFEIDSI